MRFMIIWFSYLVKHLEKGLMISPPFFRTMKHLLFSLIQPGLLNCLTHPWMAALEESLTMRLVNEKRILP